MSILTKSFLLLAELVFSGINCVMIFKRPGLGLRTFILERLSRGHHLLRSLVSM